MTKAVKSEIRKLFERGAYKVILKEDIVPDGNVLPVRFVMTIMSNENCKPGSK